LARQGARAGNDVESLLRDFSPVGAVDLYDDHKRRELRALAEGRPLDAFGNQLGELFAAASLFPIFRPGGDGSDRGCRAA
jgi:hypothetical protein